MAIVQRLQSRKEGWLHIAKALYLFIALPFLLIVGTLSLLVMPGSTPGRETIDGLKLVAMFWIPIIIPMTYFYMEYRSRRRLLKRVVSTLKDQNVFFPQEGFEFSLPQRGTYFGIDTRNGTILYIQQIRKGQLDVVGLDMKDWTQREVEGTKLRLYTKLVELPRIEIPTLNAERWYDTLGAMEHRRYSTPVPFSQYVSQHVEALERDNKIHIPKLA